MNVYQELYGWFWSRNNLRKNGSLMQESNAKVLYFCVCNLFGFLEFLQGFKAFLSQIFDLFIVANGVQFIGKGFVV